MANYVLEERFQMFTLMENVKLCFGGTVSNVCPILRNFLSLKPKHPPVVHKIVYNVYATLLTSATFLIGIRPTVF